MLYHLLITPLLLGGLLAGWIGFQAWVRKCSPGLAADADTLRGRFSCGTCFDFETCRDVLTRPRKESVADSEILEVDRVDEVAL